MADALCGPSNALQNFQKHTSVDRTLQQDRLVGRHSPSQGFRSSPGANAGALDHEFEAFQVGHTGPLQPQFQHLPPHLAHPPPPQFAQASQAPDWASDFQRLNISHAPQAPLQRAPAPNAASSWHQDFMNQQGPAAQAPTFQQNNFGGMYGYGVSGFTRPAFQQTGFGIVSSGPMSEVAQGKQRAQEAVPQFDEAAFEQAFANVQQAEEEAHAEELWQQQRESEESSTAIRDQATERLLELDEPALLRIQEQRPAIYAALKLHLNATSQASPYLDTLENMESTHRLTENLSEARWIVDTLQNIVNREAPQDIKTRSEQLIRTINERLMSMYPLHSLATPINHDWILDIESLVAKPEAPMERMEEAQPEQKQDEPLPRHDDDEMAETAGRLLERVSDNTSEKFQNSQFLSLMRRLRDREVRVQGDKMVEVSTTAQSTSTPSATALPPQPSQHQYPTPPSTVIAVPPIDPTILDHAATDFAMPVFPDATQYAALSRHSSHEHITDEVSDQYRHYNVFGAYRHHHLLHDQHQHS